MTSGLVPASRFSSTNIGEPAVGPPKRTAPIGPSRKVSMPIDSGAGAVVYFFSGSTTVVIVLPSLVSRTAPASRSSLLGRTKVELQRPDLPVGLAPERHRDHELALVGVGRQRLVGVGHLFEQCGPRHRPRRAALPRIWAGTGALAGQHHGRRQGQSDSATPRREASHRPIEASRGDSFTGTGNAGDRPRGARRTA